MSGAGRRAVRRVTAIAVATAATTATMLVLDLTWLGVLARGLYDSSLAPLKRASVFLPAAGLFYAFYVGGDHGLCRACHDQSGGRSPVRLRRASSPMALMN
jgi:uncharacterized membrane protein